MPVERHVKERLVGAAVLMAAAIILIPEMLSGPDRPATQDDAPIASENSVKTYTIDLGDSSGSSSAAAQTVERAPPPEVAGAAEQTSQSSPSNMPQTSPEARTAAPASGSANVRNLESPSPESARVLPAPVEPSNTVQAPRRTAEQSAPPQLASAPAVPTTKGWAVQLGSFSSRESAERLADEFQAERYDTFVMPVKSGAATLYRVRVGPLKDRAAADDALKRIKAKVAGATVVTHP